jgi:hypothetical protein
MGRLKAAPAKAMGRLLIVVGLVIALIGVAVSAGVPLGRLPGDITIRRGGVTFYLPVATCIVLSIVLTLISVLISFFTKR